jgi:NAD(P)-dependent dehydrogenase (short-subunit alcohol dehydrogenase family)
VVVLITGASTGIGRLAAETVARAGHTVYAGMRDIATRNAAAARSLQDLAGAEELSLHALDMDVCHSDSVQQAVDQILRETGRLDVAVSNAGLMSIGLAEGFTEEQVLHQMNVNFMGAFRLARAALPHLRARHSGLIVHVTSIVGRLLFPGCALYCASKFAHEAFAEVLHYELSGSGVDSVIVEPGPYPSRLLANSPAPADIERLSGYGDLAQLRERFVAQFAELFASAAAPRTQDVADAIVGLIEMPAGERPLRTVCGVEFGAHTLNEQAAPIRANVLRALGMDQLIAATPAARFG